jgi:hypothetical protein
MMAARQNPSPARTPTRAVGEQLGQQAAHEDEIWSETVVDCGWGRLIFGQTFDNLKRLAECLQDERAGTARRGAVPARPARGAVLCAAGSVPGPVPHLPAVAGSLPVRTGARGLLRAAAEQPADAEAAHRLYASRKMVPPSPEFIWEQRASRVLQYWVAEDEQDGAIIGVVNGVDHHEAFGDVEGGASLWALAWMPRRRIRASARPWCARWRSSIRRAGGRSWTCR